MKQKINSKVKFECMECGKKFEKPIPKIPHEVKCPKCKSVDVEVA